ncbi:GerMN domain-containing protein [Paenibacillus kandeliae]|uniref:GerMN domain-containing protein n=1 Tax=Paenibacillus kandeliae TaxID=3231269 RepID=UPI00345ADD7B
MKKGMYVALVICAVSIFSVACIDKPASNMVQGSNPVSSEAVSTTSPDKTNEQSQEINVYYADVQVSKLEEHTQTIVFNDDTQKYSATYAALQDSKQKDLIPLWGTIDLRSDTFAQGKLTLDIHIPNEARLGAGGEALAIEALKKTFFQFNEVTSIEVLVDGKETDSLMGHTELTNPITRE